MVEYQFFLNKTTQTKQNLLQKKISFFFNKKNIRYLNLTF